MTQLAEKKKDKLVRSGATDVTKRHEKFCSAVNHDCTKIVKQYCMAVLFYMIHQCGYICFVDVKE